MDGLLKHLHDRRVALGLVDLPEVEAQIRIRALSKLTSEQFLALLALPDEPRAAHLRAMDAGQRRTHALFDLRAVARSEFDDRILYRWWCACGAESPGDHFSGSLARAGWETHAGIAARPEPEPSDDQERRECAWSGCQRGAGGGRRTFAVRPDRERQRFCSAACREADRTGGQDRPRLFGTEE